MTKFQNKDNQLGDLQEPIFSERRESEFLRKTPGAAPPGQLVKVDPNNAFQKVVSAFDARPTNANDFYVDDLVYWDLPPGGGVETKTATFSVADGHIGIIRKFRFTPSIIMSDYLSLNFSVKINGSFIPSFNALSVDESFGSNYQSIYFIAEQNSNIDFIFTIDTSSSFFDFIDTSTYETFEIIVELYGNKLISTGVPAPFQPGEFVTPVYQSVAPSEVKQTSKLVSEPSPKPTIKAPTKPMPTLITTYDPAGAKNRGGSDAVHAYVVKSMSAQHFFKWGDRKIRYGIGTKKDPYRFSGPLDSDPLKTYFNN